jgi:hypothetical protein
VCCVIVIVLCAASNSPTFVNNEKPRLLPASICEELCSTNQSGWWKAVYQTYKSQTNGNISALRYQLRKGIETIRAFGNHGLDVMLIVSLAKIFEQRVSTTQTHTLHHFEQHLIY